jgi:hypothetical protein
MINSLVYTPIDMITPKEMYTLHCDGCGKDICDGTEHSAWDSKAWLEEMAENEYWEIINGQHYCPDCFMYDEDDQLIIKPRQE